MPSHRPAATMQHAIYLSRAVQSFTNDQLQDLAAAASARNAGMDVTGLLLFSGGNFLQVLEGPSPAIAPLVERIARDARHTDLRVLRMASLPKRTFSAWHMGVLNVSELRPVDAAHFEMLTRILFAKSPEHSDRAVRSLLRRFRAMLPAAAAA